MSTWVTINRTCNLRCKWCYAKGTQYRPEDTISVENFKKIADFIKECGDNQILLIGGEPSVYCHLLECVEYCSKIGLKSVLVTNGVILSDNQFVNQLKKAGLSSLDISIKGASDQEYKNSCGLGKYSDVLKAVKNCSEAFKENFSCSFVVTHENIDTFCDAIKDVCAAGCYRVNLSFAYDFNMSPKKNKYWIYADDPILKIKKFMDHVEEIDKYTSGRWGFELGYPLCLYTEEQLKRLGKHMSSCCQLIENNAMLFDTDLNSIPCNMMYDLKCGKFGTDFENYAQFKKIKESKYKKIYDALRSLPDDRCAKCSNYKYCGGGCVCFWTNTSFENVDKYLKIKNNPPKYSPSEMNQEIDYVCNKLSSEEDRNSEILSYFGRLHSSFCKKRFLNRLSRKNIINRDDDEWQLLMYI